MPQNWKMLRKFFHKLWTKNVNWYFASLVVFQLFKLGVTFTEQTNDETVLIPLCPPFYAYLSPVMSLVRKAKTLFKYSYLNLRPSHLTNWSPGFPGYAGSNSQPSVKRHPHKPPDQHQRPYSTLT